MRLQPAAPAVAARGPYGCSLRHLRLQARFDAELFSLTVDELLPTVQALLLTLPLP